MKKLLIKLAIWYLNKHGVYPASIKLNSVLYFDGGFFKVESLYHCYNSYGCTELDIKTKCIEPPAKK